MHFSKKTKVLVILVILGLITFAAIYFYQDYQHQQVKELKQAFETKIEQAEEYRNIQLDTAQIYAEEAYNLVKEESGLEYEKNIALLTLSGIDFLRKGASDELYERVEKCEDWFKSKKYYREAVRSCYLRIEIKEFIAGWNNTVVDVDELMELAKLSGDERNLSLAYYTRMDYRDYMRDWSDDVYLLDSARVLASSEKDQELLAKIRLMSVLPVNGTPASHDSAFLSLDDALRLKLPSLECEVYRTLGMQFAPIRKIDSSLFYLDQGISCAQKWGSKNHEMLLYQQKVRTFLYAAEYDSMLVTGKIALRLAKQTNHREKERILSKEMGIAWINKGEYNKGIDYIFHALELAKQNGDEDGIYRTQFFLINFLLKSKRLDEAEEIISQMFEWANAREKSYANENILGNVYFSKGSLFEAKGDLDSALYSYREGARVLKGHSSGDRILNDFRILSVLIDSEKFDEAKKQYEFISKTYNNDFLLSRYNNFEYLEGRLMYNLGNYDVALSLLEKYLSRTSEKQYEFNAKVCFILADIYEMKGQLKRAMEYNKKGVKYTEESYRSEDELKLERLQSKYELSQKESEIQKLHIEGLEQKNDLEIKENKLETRRLYIIFLVVSIVLLGVIVLSVSRRAKDALLKKELERKALENQREIERLKAEESKRSIELKNQLFANISHEFRTPLTLINAPVEELMDSVDEENKQSLEVIKRNANHLLEMVDEILELSRLDAGEAVLSKKAFSLDSFIQKLQFNFEPILKQKDIELKSNLPEKQYIVTGDDYRLKMVLNNLLKNAFHHTQKNGKISLNVELKESESQLKISIFNSGENIDDQFLPFIFDRYARSNEQDYSGYGIGLSFCKKIIELHDGTISAENVDGGVLLSLAFPTSYETGQPIIVEESVHFPELKEVEMGIQEGHTLLIVEDNLEVQNLLQGMLSSQYQILLADDGEEGIALAKEQQPDLIISDIMMPKVDGTELTKTLKEEFATSHIPIILLTAKSAGHDKIAGLEVGADDYLTKPFSPKELRIRVKNLIEQREKLKKRFSKNVFLMPEEITSTSLDQEFLKKATKIVEENMENSEFNVEKFCRALALNRNSVHQKLKSLTGNSASQFIKSVKLKKAATLLADERISIIEVSELSGFNNRQAFYKAFKEQFEMTPTDFRKSILEKE